MPGSHVRPRNTTPLYLDIANSILEDVDNFRFKIRAKTRKEAFEQLLRIGLAAARKPRKSA